MTTGRVSIDLDDGVGVVEFDRAPSNYFDLSLIGGIEHAYAELDADDRCRVIVLASTGKHFCAGADFNSGSDTVLPADAIGETGPPLYALASRLLEHRVPVVAAVQGAAVGGGLGLALTADFRVAANSTRFVCNFARLGLHHGFGLSVTLPSLIGQQRALELLYTGGTVTGVDAFQWGLCDRLVEDPATVRPAAVQFARKIAAAAPLAVESIRTTMRGHLASAVRNATALELQMQLPLVTTTDFNEGVAAARDRREPTFTRE